MNTVTNPPAADRLAALPALPPSFAATRDAVHVVAELVLAQVRHAAVGRIGLEPIAGGIATPAFGPENRVIGVRATCDGADVFDGARRAPLTTVAAAAEFFGVSPGIPKGLWHQKSRVAVGAPLSVDPAALHALVRWYELVRDALVSAAAELRLADASGLTLWPEDFDLAMSGGRVNLGGSPGDAHIHEPYLYVGPWDRPLPTGPAWGEAFGAARRYGALAHAEDARAFFTARAGEARRDR